MVKKLLPFLIFLIATTAFGQESLPKNNDSPGYLNESDKFVFFSHYWLNMHHFFYQEAQINSVADSSAIAPTIWDKLNDSKQDALNEVINYYEESLIEKNYRSSDYMSEFKEWVIQQDKEKLTSVPDKFKKLIAHLRDVDSIYKKYFWDRHNKLNKKILSKNIEHINNTEEYVTDKLSSLAREYWQENKIRVDIANFALSQSWTDNLWAQSYTTIFPTHIVISSSQIPNTPFGQWIETLYHEASHHIIGSQSGFVGGTIKDVAKVNGFKIPNSLWHTYLFYFSGVVTQKALKKQGIEYEEIGLVRNPFSVYLPFLKKYLPKYMDAKITLSEATTSIIQDIYERSKK